MKDTCDGCKISSPITKTLTSFFLERKKYHLEWTMIKYTFSTIFLLFLLVEIAAFTFLREKATYLIQFPWVVYLIITIPLVFGAVYHIHAHKTSSTSMMGMVIGMILGMQAGVMLSVIIGSTNGMFMGSLFGLLFGVCVGVYAGRYCGLMGVLNGALMGAMGGTMAATATIAYSPRCPTT